MTRRRGEVDKDVGMHYQQAESFADVTSRGVRPLTVRSTYMLQGHHHGQQEQIDNQAGLHSRLEAL